MKLAVLLAVTACGRIDFPPIHPGDDGANGTPSDGAKQPDAVPHDSAPTACAAATLMAQVGVTLPVNTCVDPDRLDGCGPPGTKEALVEFIPPASSGYDARAYDRGTLNITMASVKVFDNTCGNASACAAILGTTYTQDVPAYFVIEASSGGCADVDFLIN